MSVDGYCESLHCCWSCRDLAVDTTCSSSSRLLALPILVFSCSTASSRFASDAITVEKNKNRPGGSVIV